MDKLKYDVIIIGGGPSGLSAALVLGRSRIKTLILNTEKPRNIVTTHSHTFLTQDGKHPSEIFKSAKKDIDKYDSILYKKEEVKNLIKNEDGFTVESDQNTYQAKRVVIASGYRDDLEACNVPGLESVYGKSIFPCPFCDGYEIADKKLAVIGGGNFAPYFAKIVAQWSKDIVIFTNGDNILDLEVMAQLKSKNIEIYQEKIIQLHSEDGLLKQVELESGKLIAREAGFYRDIKVVENTPFADQFNISWQPGHFGMRIYEVNESSETKVEGLYIIGDAGSGWKGVAPSVAEGYELGTKITEQIALDFWL